MTVGTWKSLGSKSDDEISFARSVSVSEKAQKHGGFALPPNDKRSITYATCPRIRIVWAAADPEWDILL